MNIFFKKKSLAWVSVLLVTLYSVGCVTASTSEEQRPLEPSIKKASMGMGLSAVADWSTQMPFIDLMKQSRSWKDWQTKSKTPPPIQTNKDDWVTKLLPNQVAGTVFLVAPTKRELLYKRYVVNYTGTGELRYGWSTKLIESESKPGHHVIEVGKGNNLLEIIATKPTDPIKDISIVAEEHYPAFKKGKIFNPDWINLIEQFNTLRYMDWLDTNNSKLSSWSDRAKVEHRTWRQRGVPIEIIAKLAEITNTHLWINIPHLAEQDFIVQFAQNLKANVPKHLDIYVEHSNEVWNWQFKQAHYAKREGTKIFGDVGPAFMRWHGMRTAQICEIFKDQVFTKSNERVHCVLGVQTAWHGLEKEALDCPGWPAAKGKPCYKYGFDHIAITSYFHGHLNGPRKGKTNAEHAEKLIEWASKPGGVDSAFAQLESGKPLSKTKPFTDYEGVAAKLKREFSYWSAVAKKYDTTLVAYEGGQHITSNGHALESNKEIVNFHQAINSDKRMQEIYSQMLNIWKTQGGELHMHFVDISKPSKWGSWGARKYLDQTSPKWEALVEFNSEIDCWWQGCAVAHPEK